MLTEVRLVERARVAAQPLALELRANGKVLASEARLGAAREADPVRVLWVDGRLDDDAYRAVERETGYGRVTVFYPENEAARATAAMFVEIDPIGLVRGGQRAMALDQYVNDRPYVASSFTTVALREAFSSALAGKSKDRPALVETPLPLRARIPAVAVSGGVALVERLFAPLGYTVKATARPLDERFPGWGESQVIGVELSAEKTVHDLLTHLYVLLPVLDNDKHYFVGDDEVAKLVAHGEGWLAAHPEKVLITNRYLAYQRGLVRDALSQLTLGQAEADEDAEAKEQVLEEKVRLNDQRLEAVLAALRAPAEPPIHRVVDMGCGEGKLLRALLEDRPFKEVVGVDVASATLERAEKRLALDRKPQHVRDRVKLLQGSLVYGHTPTPEAEWLNGTINIDQGCCFGGKLTALRWPEREIVSEPAQRTYYEPARPFLPADAPRAPDAPPLQWQHDEVLDLEDVTGKRVIATPLERSITIRAEHAAAALEVLSRFAVDPRWLVYLPPTMSPCETSKLDGFLEHPAEALDYFKHHGVAEVVCEEKHMGSRAVLVLCRDEAAGLDRFGRRALGACYTRTGRAFFRPEMERAVLERLAAAVARAGFWEEIASSWVVLDCEVMPWNLKAQELLRTQYAAVGAAADAVLPDVEAALAAASARGLALGERIDHVRAQRAAVERFREAYRHYCWDVASLDDVKIAPFHVLAAEWRTFFDRDHVWHMETLGRLAGADPLFHATPWRLVNTLDEAACRGAIEWWLEMTAAGGEGFVVKPRSYVARSSGRIVQPAVKCRGREYLRIIYGPDYLEPQHLERLRRRGLAHKRGLALREFALGLEGLERFARREPLRRVHECAFGVLALESEPVDPRL